MDEQLARAIGQRVRLHRSAKRQKQTVVAELTGITPDYLYQIERGKKVPTVPVLVQLATVLGVPVSALLGEEGTTEPSAPPTRPSTPAEELCRAMTGLANAPSTPPSPHELVRRVRSAWETWQTAQHRYSRLTGQLPALVHAVELAAQHYRNEQQARKTARCAAADLYNLLRSVAKRLGRVDLALLAADRAIRAAEAVDDRLRLAAAHWNMAHVLLADRQPEHAEAVALQAAERLRPLVADADSAALHGALVLVSAVAAARRGAVWQARTRLSEAAQVAEKTGEQNTCWTVFGPTNVAMHAVTIEVETGETTEALRLAERVDYHRSPSIERRTAFLLEQARAHQRRRDFGSALVLLQTAEREAPEDIRHRPAVRAILRTLVQRAPRTVAGEASRLAARAGIALD